MAWGISTFMTMCLIFVLAGAFAETARRMGAVDSTIQIALSFIPPHLMPLRPVHGGLLSFRWRLEPPFGTIVALTPIALGDADSRHFRRVCLGAVVGGAMFGGQPFDDLGYGQLPRPVAGN